MGKWIPGHSAKQTLTHAVALCDAYFAVRPWNGARAIIERKPTIQREIWSLISWQLLLPNTPRELQSRRAGEGAAGVS